MTLRNHVSRVWDVVDPHRPRRGRVQVQLTLRRELLKGDSTAKSGDNIVDIH